MKKTLLILGAGSSKAIYPYFPTGVELIRDIWANLTLEKKVFNSTGKDYMSDLTNKIFDNFDFSESEIHALKFELWEYVTKFEYSRIRYKNVTYSIDDFIQNHVHQGKFQEVVRYSVAYFIMGYEQALKDILATKSLERNWINALYEQLKAYKLEVIKKNVFVISFNYDRTFAYLFNRFFHGDFPNNIIHTYGCLGELKKIPFVTKNDDKQLMLETCENFHFMRSRNFTSSEKLDTIIFLGFGFDQKNLENIKGILKHGKRIIGTGMGIDKLTKSRLEKYRIEILDKSCIEILSEMSNE